MFMQIRGKEVLKRVDDTDTQINGLGNQVMTPPDVYRLGFLLRE